MAETPKAKESCHSQTFQRNALSGSKGPAYWDNLSKIRFTKGVLRELDRRNSYLEPRQEYHRPVTRQLSAKRKKRWRPQFAPDFVRDCTPTTIKQLERLSRRGGPDFSDLRNYPIPGSRLNEPIDTGESTSLKRKRNPAPQAPLSSSASSSSLSSGAEAYSRNFEQHLLDHAVYPDNPYVYGHAEELPTLPNNWDEINEALAQRRPSLSSSKFSQEEFRKFCQRDTYAHIKRRVMADVVPIIEGDCGDPRCHGGGYIFGNLDPLTDAALPRATPSHFYGARPEQLDRQIRKELSNQIIPSKWDSRPLAPNFFLEARGCKETPVAGERQVCYNGALGARAMHALQSYQANPIFDNNAYAITSKYYDGTLLLYAIYATKPRSPSCRPEYIMALLNAWSMTTSPEEFRRGASAYRNARDWAKKKRDELIESANRRHLQAQSQSAPAAVSTTRDETERQNVQLRLARPAEDVEDIRKQKRPRRRLGTDNRLFKLDL